MVRQAILEPARTRRSLAARPHAGRSRPRHQVYPRDHSPTDLKHLSDILGAYADDRGWDGFVLGDEL